MGTRFQGSRNPASSWLLGTKWKIRWEKRFQGSSWETKWKTQWETRSEITWEIKRETKRQTDKVSRCFKILGPRQGEKDSGWQDSKVPGGWQVGNTMKNTVRYNVQRFPETLRKHVRGGRSCGTTPVIRDWNPANESFVCIIFTQNSF